MRTGTAPVLIGLAFTAILATAAAQAPSGDVKAGVDAWQAGDYPRAVAQWQGPAAAGDPDAEFNLGQAYKYGRGVPQDLGRASQLYGQAAAKGHKEAEANLGLLMFQTGDHAGAIPHLQHAADLGDPRAQYYLGTACFNGDGVPIDQVKAYALMTRAASSGLPPASTSLAQMDGYLSQAVRQKGVALAKLMAAHGPERPIVPAPQQIAATKAGALPPPRQPTPPPAPIARAELPPSAPAATATARPAHPAPSPAVHTAPAVATRPVAAAPQTAAPAGSWRVQLGAFGTDAKAQELWTRVSQKFGGLAGKQPYLIHAGAITRLQAGPFASKAAADQLCAQAKAGGQDCIQVHP